MAFELEKLFISRERERVDRNAEKRIQKSRAFSVETHP